MKCNIYFLILISILIISCSNQGVLNDLPTVEETVVLDSRNSIYGNVIYKSGYIDQPYLTVLPNGKLFCSLTSGIGNEGDDGESIKYTFSSDGKSWDDLKALEPNTQITSSYSVPYLTKYGRLYVFYNYNGDAVNFLNGLKIRNDMLGWLCYRYSDDFGKTWSNRYRINIRKTKVDFSNNWQGEVQMFWTIHKPIVTRDNNFILCISKIGKYEIENTEGWIIKSSNIESEKNPSNINWELLPNGENPIYAPEMGSRQEEHNLVELNNQDLYVVFRTSKGYIGYSKSRDGGYTWQNPAILKFNNGNIIKNSIALPRIFKLENGKYVLWFHNTSANVRNPVWISGGTELDGNISWNQPEILLYSDEFTDRFSYPDLIKFKNDYWLTETQKKTARIHKLDNSLLNALWSQGIKSDFKSSDISFEASNVNNESYSFSNFQIPNLLNGGFGIDLEIQIDTLTVGQTIFTNQYKDSSGLMRGVAIRVGDSKNIYLELRDGNQVYYMNVNLSSIKSNTISLFFNVDGNTRVMNSFLNGNMVQDGNRYSGWTRFDSSFNDVKGKTEGNFLNFFTGKVKRLRLINKPSTTTEIVNSYLFFH